MDMDRRRFLAGSALLGAGLPAMRCARAAADPGSPARRRALHLLNRLGYGPRPGDLDRVLAMGVDGFLAAQLEPGRLAKPPDLARRLAGLATLRLNPAQLFETYGPPALRRTPGEKPSPEERGAARLRARVILDEARAARLWRAVDGPRQLQSVMTEFWFNHFNVFAGKGLDHLWIGSFEAEAIRPHALGRFRDLLGATARHPAMLVYLDNWRNTAPGSPAAHGPARGLNENYAREVMELHTLGVDGGYTQADVVALARIFTGWGLPLARMRASGAVASGDGSFFRFDAQRHDYGAKRFLGRRIAGSGLAEGEEALDLLAGSPATARHIAYQIAQYFVADTPDPALVETLAQRFATTGGAIAEMLRALVASRQFWNPVAIGGKFKTPYQYVLSTVRLAGVPLLDTRPLAAALARLGMPLYGCQTPDGYNQAGVAWLNPDAMEKRLAFAMALASGRLPLDRPPPEAEAAAAFDGRPLQSEPSPPLDAARLAAAYGGGFSARTREAVAAAPPRLQAAPILGSPELMYR